MRADDPAEPDFAPLEEPAAPRTLTVALARPVAHAGGEIVEVTVREPSAGEMREAERKLDAASPVEGADAFEVALLGAVSGLSEDAIGALPVSVMQRLRDFVVSFDMAAPDAAEQLADELELELPEPMKIGGALYTAITVREPTVAMRRRARTALRAGTRPAAVRHYCVILVAEASGVPFATIERMPVSVVNAGATFCEGFTRPGRQAGSP